ncbi:MAG: hypothetical protein L0G94_18870 [Brachybacterium sp.]|uniref:hypothetical protein n=1 Tax=Brachybacterium sp. TaxID=1891286 RepID=UPI0026476D31|nr:hypothetical protein [Brachybacterium sp.]MDN5688718.1 hypothetical protein [Brachybacterium sp.]
MVIGTAASSPQAAARSGRRRLDDRPLAASSTTARPTSANPTTADPTTRSPSAEPFAGHLHLDETIAPVLVTDFDVAAYTRRGTSRLPVDTGLLAAEEPLAADVRTALGVLQRLESSALSESRTMLATATGNEARITAFLGTWLVDRYWQSRALRDLLTGDHPVERPQVQGRLHPLRTLRRVHVDRVQPLLSPLWTAIAGEAVAAGHMARMAIQEASLQASLHALSPRLAGEARRVVDLVAARHQAATDFFTAEAIARIDRSRFEAATARLVLTLGSPLEGGGIPDADLPAALAVLGAEARDRAALRRARFEITRLLPGPDLPDPVLSALPRSGV